MKRITSRFLHILILILILSGGLFAQNQSPKREVRGAWVATVANIDWPISNNETPGEQIKELVIMFDKLKNAGINTIYFQVRTECDALYKSKYEPWSYWLTGEQGKAPEPYFDPLAFAVSEAHSRGMELHAWLNPYRAEKKVGDYPIAENQVTKLHPDWILDFGSYKMLDPGLPQVRDYIANVVADIVRNYDVDGIHFDDYFYPYGPKITDQDSTSYKLFSERFTNVDDWRRNNINRMVAEVYDTINAINPAVKFGISPFGIVQNKYAGTNGFSSYDVIYCDPLTWLKEKTVDYVTPQLYWKVGHPAADYAKLLPWWGTVSNGRDIYVGLFSSKMAAANWNGSPNEIETQVRMERETDNVLGAVFFSAKSISQNWSHLADSLKLDLYKYPALTPTMPWKDNIPPIAPSNLTAKGDSSGILLTWDAPVKASDGDAAAKYVIYRFKDGSDIDLGNPANILKITEDAGTKFKDKVQYDNQANFIYVVTSLDKLNNESKEYVKVVYSK